MSPFIRANKCITYGNVRVTNGSEQSRELEITAALILGDLFLVFLVFEEFGIDEEGSVPSGSCLNLECKQSIA